LWLDLQIIFMTAVMFFRGDRRPQPAEQTNWTNVVQINDPPPRRAVVARATAVPRVVPRSKEHASPSALRS
jgi:hypothetical protein